MTAFFHHRSLVALRLMPQLREHVLAEGLDEPPLLLADVVQVDRRRSRARRARAARRRAARGRRRSAPVRACPPGRTCVAAWSNCSTVARSQHSGGRTRWCATARARSAAPPPRRAPRTRCTCSAIVLPSPPLSRKAATTRSSCSRGWWIVTSPSAQPPTQRGGLGAHGGADQRRRLGRQRPEACAVDAHEAVVVDHLAGEQRAHHVDALPQAGVARALVGPGVAGDVLVRELAGAERHPEPAREHLGQRGRRLGDHRRVVALPGRVDDAERQRGRLHAAPQPGPREAGLALPLAPGGEVVGAHRALEAGRLGLAHRLEQLARRDLLVGGVEPDRGHAAVVPARRSRLARRLRPSAARAPPRTRTAAGARSRSRTRAPPGSPGPEIRSRPPSTSAVNGFTVRDRVHPAATSRSSGT